MRCSLRGLHAHSPTNDSHLMMMVFTMKKSAALAILMTTLADAAIVFMQCFFK
jgi:hypothetical protein